MSERVVKPVLDVRENGYSLFWCPGCETPHAVQVSGASAWGYNGDPVKPTLTPSVKVTQTPTAYCCHSFVKDGMIQFLGDCTHALAGKTVALPPWDESRFGDAMENDPSQSEAQ